MRALAVFSGANIPARAAMALAPLIFVACWSGDVTWLRAAVVTISTFIAMERSGLAPLGVALQGLAIMLGFLGLLCAQARAPLFVFACVAMATASILLTIRGAQLRSAGNFTFIPALYLACEIGESVAPHALLMHGLTFLPFAVAALIPTIALSAILHAQDTESATGLWKNLGRLRRNIDPGEGKPWKATAITVALAVAGAAALVQWQHLENGQWVIWSAASVVTGDAGSARLKLLDRALGAVAGVPAGIGIGQLVPHNPLCYGLASLASILTLAGVRRYVVGFGLRCLFSALAIVVAGHAASIAAERLINVLLGSVIGIVFVFGVHAIANMMAEA